MRERNLSMREFHLGAISPFIILMAIVVIASNILVQYPFNHLGMRDILTWGAFTYPVAFFINDLTNRRFGPKIASKVVIFGFIIAVTLSIFLATPRIAISSGTAFIVAQFLDIAIFNRLRRKLWWKPPLISSLVGSVIDTLIFFSLAFAVFFAFLDTGFGYPDNSLGFTTTFLNYQMPVWTSLAIGDFCVKIVMGLIMLVFYKALIPVVKPVDVEFAH